MSRQGPHDFLLAFEGPPEAFRALCGELGVHLRLLGRELGVRVSQGPAQQLRVLGVDGSAELATELLEQLYSLALQGFPLGPVDVEQACRLLRRDPEVRVDHLFSETVFVPGRNRTVFPRTPNQRLYVEAMRQYDVVFGVGPAGTGKTYLAMAMAVAALKRGEVRRIVLTRPAVEAGERLGFLPGALEDKVNPYLRPLYDALHDLVRADRAQRMIARGLVEVAPLAFMRGRTLSDAFVILDEAQNTTSEQMKMFLTRLGLGARAVVTGDVTQVDLPRGQVSGMVEAMEILRGVEGIRIVAFTAEDVVRHPLVASIVAAYERAERARQRGEGGGDRGEE